MPLRAVMDTNVLYAALYSRLGASFEIVRRLRAGEWTAVVSNHLVHEYEEILKAKAGELGLSLKDIGELLNAISARAEECRLRPGWWPVLADPRRRAAGATRLRIERQTHCDSQLETFVASHQNRD